MEAGTRLQFAAFVHTLVALSTGAATGAQVEQGFFLA
jgi:hypothetical protein